MRSEACGWFLGMEGMRVCHRVCGEYANVTGGVLRHSPGADCGNWLKWDPKLKNGDPHFRKFNPKKRSKFSLSRLQYLFM